MIICGKPLRAPLSDELWTLTLRCLYCILIPLCLLVGITLGLQAGRDIGAICNHNRGAAAESTVEQP